MSKTTSTISDQAKPKKPYRRTTTRAVLDKAYNRTEILGGVSYMLSQNMIARNPKAGALKHLDKNELLKYVPTCALANLKAAIEQNKEKLRKGVQPAKEDEVVELSKMLVRDIHKAMKSLPEGSIPNFGHIMLLKREHLIPAVATCGKSTEIIHFAKIAAEERASKKSDVEEQPVAPKETNDTNDEKMNDH